MGAGGSWWELVGAGGSWWELVGAGGSWWELVGAGGSWWELVGAGGSCSSVTEHWHIKPKAMDLTPGSSTFISCYFAILKVHKPYCHAIRSLDLVNQSLNGLIGVPPFGQL